MISFIGQLTAVLGLLGSPGLAAPSPAEDYAAFQRKAIRLYFAEAQTELRSAREQLEYLQEFGLDPHRADVPVIAALRRVDRAEALIAHASTTLSDLVPRFVPAEAELSDWTPIEDRIEAALKLIDRSTVAAEIGKLYRTSLPIEVYPCPGNAIAFYSSKLKLVRVRGYYGVNPIPAPFLAAVLVHEGAHSLQHRRLKKDGRRFRADFSGEVEAREMEARFWNELGAPVGEDQYRTETEQLTAYKQGPAAFEAHVRVFFKQSPFWEWVEPAIPKPPKPRALAAAELKALAEELDVKELTAEDAARELKAIQDLEDSIRHNVSVAAAQRLESARERLEQIPEILASYPKIANHSTMTIKADRLDEYPMLMRLGHALLTTILNEIDAARSAASRRSSSEELDRARQALASAEPDGPRESPGLGEAILERLKEAETGRPLAELWEKEGLRLGLVPWSDPKLEAEHPERLLIPGRLFQAKPEKSLGAVWAAHQLVHRRQGLKPGQEPGVDQEVEAWVTTNKVWYELGNPDLTPYSGSHGHRLLAAMAVWEAGGAELTRIYLGSRAKRQWK